MFHSASVRRCCRNIDIFMFFQRAPETFRGMFSEFCNILGGKCRTRGSATGLYLGVGVACVGKGFELFRYFFGLVCGHARVCVYLCVSRVLEISQLRPGPLAGQSRERASPMKRRVHARAKFLTETFQTVSKKHFTKLKTPHTRIWRPSIARTA